MLMKKNVAMLRLHKSSHNRDEHRNRQVKVGSKFRNTATVLNKEVNYREKTATVMKK